MIYSAKKNHHKISHIVCVLIAALFSNDNNQTEFHF